MIFKCSLEWNYACIAAVDIEHAHGLRLKHFYLNPEKNEERFAL